MDIRRQVFRICAGIACVGAMVAACGDDAVGAGDDDRDVVLVRVGGDFQHASALATLDEPLVVRAIDRATLQPVVDLPVRFDVEHLFTSGARLSDTVVRTSADGTARTELTLGALEVPTVTVRVTAGVRAEERFTTLVSPAPRIARIEPAEFRGGDTVRVFGVGLAFAARGGVVRFGGVAAPAEQVSDTALRAIVPSCLAAGEMTVGVTRGGARSTTVRGTYVARNTPLALPLYGGVTLDAAQLSSCATLGGGGSEYLVIAQLHAETEEPLGIDVEVGAGSAAPAALPAATAIRATNATPRAFESLLRRRETQLAAARPGRASVRAPAPPAAVGDLKSFTIIANLAATEFATATTRLRYAGAHINVWVDTSTPPGLPDTLLQSLSRLFDTELYPLDATTFGTPSDVDGNGRVDVVLSPVVNGISGGAQCSASGFVAGFFSAHDLYPGSAHANGAEAFYGIVPDSAGRYGCAHSLTEFSSVIRTAFVHELQHVINYQQHVLLRGGKEEAVWLNEGMSHMAEELASKLYERRFPPPTGRGDPNQIFPDSAQNFIVFNLVNSFLFLRQSFYNSLTNFNQGGTIEERGGAWLFLRWLADQYGEDILRRLVQTSRSGKDNVADRTGEPFERVAADFAIASYMDSLPGLPRTIGSPRWHFRTRNLRVLYGRLATIAAFPPYPIEPYPIPYGESLSAPLRAGGFVYFRVSVPAGSPGTTLRFVPLAGVDWPAGFSPQVSIVRLQ